jgi:hypothetical protein
MLNRFRPVGTSAFNCHSEGHTLFALESTMDAGNQPNARSFPLRMPRSLKAAAKLLADRDGISLNHFVNLAVAEKVERISRGSSSPSKAKRA